jgi:UDP-N-acetylglucosamine 2-epimerase (non-hydrolysing)
MKLLSVLGTRPEAIKMAPVLTALAREPSVESLLCVTAQHRALLDQVLEFFSLTPDYDLDLMVLGQSLNSTYARAIEQLDNVFEKAKPDRVIVQGDTTTASAAAWAAFQRNIPVAHVEAGLRTYSPGSPFPEEANRRKIALISDLHFAPTEAAKANLRGERLHGEVLVTGNSGIDALAAVLRRIDEDGALRRTADEALPPVCQGKKLILVTAHRRESFGDSFASVCEALVTIAGRGDAHIVYPLHPNPELSAVADRLLARRPNIELIPPLGLPVFVRLMQRADLVLTDSGGVQEEAVALAKPVLVIRDVTERPEGIGTGAARLVGTASNRIVRQIVSLLDDPAMLMSFSRQPRLYGDGRASRRIVDGLLGRPVEEFAGAANDDQEQEQSGEA